MVSKHNNHPCNMYMYRIVSNTSSFARVSYSEVWLTLASLAHSHGRDEAGKECD